MALLALSAKDMTLAKCLSRWAGSLCANVLFAPRSVARRAGRKELWLGKAVNCIFSLFGT